MLTNTPRFGNIDFNGGNLSSDGGAILMFEFFKRHLHLDEKIAHVPFYDDRSIPEYSNQELCLQMICKNVLGYFNQSDQKFLSHDPLIYQYYKCCSQATVSRFYARAANASNVALKEQLTRTACEYVNAHVDEPLIDADSTLVTTCGHQEASAYIHHYGEIGYHPLVINEFHSKLLLSAVLRTGSAYSANGIIGELQTIMPFLNNNGKIRFRGDSAFYDTKLLSYLEENNIHYYIRTKSFKALLCRIHLAVNNTCTDEDWAFYTASKPLYGETEYETAGCGKKRRIVYKAYWVEENGQMSLLPIIYAIVTNDTAMSPKDAMDFYEQRGASENFTKELKGDFHAGTLSHKGFYQNELDFLICCFGYNLYHIYQNTILTGRDSKLTMNSYRQLFQKIAVRISYHARKVSLAFSSSYTQQVKFKRYWNLVMQN